MNKYENTLTNISLSDMPKKDKVARLIDLAVVLTEDMNYGSAPMSCRDADDFCDKIKQCAMALVE